MDYVNLFSRAWALIRRNRLLWALGFLAALPGRVLSSIRIGPELNLSGGNGLLLGNTLDVSGWARALRLLGGDLIAATFVTLAAAVAFFIAILCAKAALIAVTQALTRQEPVVDLAAGLNLGVHHLMPVTQATLLLYVPYLLASDLVGEVLHLTPGLLRLPVYVVLLVLLVVAAVLAVLHPLAIGGIVLRGKAPRASIEDGWLLLRQRGSEAAVIGGALLALGLVMDGLAGLVLQPVTGVSLLALLLAGGQGGLILVLQGVGLLLLGIIATAILAVAWVFGLVTLTLVYEAWDGEASR